MEVICFCDVQTNWLEDDSHVTVQVTIVNGSKDIWILSFPKDPSGLTRYACTSASGKCAIQPQQACSASTSSDATAGVETMSIVPTSSACSAGSIAGSSADGTALTYGLKVRHHNSCLDVCTFS